MATLVIYVLYCKNKDKILYFACILGAFLALLAKPMAVTLPVIMLLVDYCYGRKLTKNVLIEKVPFFLISFLFGFINLYFHRFQVPSKFTQALGSKIFFVAKVIPFYLGKLFVPTSLSAMYPYYYPTSAQMLEGAIYAVLVGVFLAILIAAIKFNKEIFFGGAFFVVTIALVLKVVPATDVFAADRYMYLPSVGLFYILAVLIYKFITKERGGLRVIRVAAISIFFLWAFWLVTLTWQRCKVWKNTETLFLDVIKKYPEIPLSYNNLGVYYERKGDLNKALELYRKAVMINPDYDSAQNNFRKTFEEIGGKTTDKSAMQENRDRAIMLNAQGVSAGKSGDLKGAIDLFEEAAQADPSYAESYNNLGFVYHGLGDTVKAKEYFKKTLELDPDHEKARTNLQFMGG